MAILKIFSRAWRRLYSKNRAKPRRSKSPKPSAQVSPLSVHSRFESTIYPSLPTCKRPVNNHQFHLALSKIRIDWSWFSAFDKLIAMALYAALEFTDSDISQIVLSFEQNSNHRPRDIFNANSNLLMLPAERYDPLDQSIRSIDYQLKIGAQIQQVKVMLKLGWADDTIILYLKLARRGFEPLFPSTWQRDFPLFPENLFHPHIVDESDAFIHSVLGSEFRATRAFDKLCAMGQSVRESLVNHTSLRTRPEAVMESHIKAYIKWALEDVGILAEVEYGRIPRLVTVATGLPGMTADKLQERVTSRLRMLSRRLLMALRDYDSNENEAKYIDDPPTLYGIVIYKTVVAIVAYEPFGELEDIRTIGFYHFDNHLEEVWNSISLGILINYVRFQMLRIKYLLEIRSLSTNNNESWSDDENSVDSTSPIDYTGKLEKQCYTDIVESIEKDEFYPPRSTSNG